MNPDPKLLAGSDKNHFESGSWQLRIRKNDKLIKIHNFEQCSIKNSESKKLPKKLEVIKKILQKLISRRNVRNKVRVCRATLLKRRLIHTFPCRIRVRIRIRFWIRNYLKSRICIRKNYFGYTALDQKIPMVTWCI